MECKQMKFIRQNDGSLNILVSDEDDYDVTDDNGVDVILSQEQVQELKGVLCAIPIVTTERDKVLDAVIQEITQAAPMMESKQLFITVLSLCRRIDRLRTPSPEGDDSKC